MLRSLSFFIFASNFFFSCDSHFFNNDKSIHLTSKSESLEVNFDDDTRNIDIPFSPSNDISDRIKAFKKIISQIIQDRHNKLKDLESDKNNIMCSKSEEGNCTLEFKEILENTDCEWRLYIPLSQDSLRQEFFNEYMLDVRFYHFEYKNLKITKFLSNKGRLYDVNLYFKKVKNKYVINTRLIELGLYLDNYQIEKIIVHKPTTTVFAKSVNIDNGDTFYLKAEYNRKILIE